MDFCNSCGGPIAHTAGCPGRKLVLEGPLVFDKQMKPAEIIQKEKLALVRDLTAAINRFTDLTGYHLSSVEIPFIETSGLKDEGKKTMVGRIDITVVL